MLFRRSHNRSVKRTETPAWTWLLFIGFYVACYLLRDDTAPGPESQDDIFRELSSNAPALDGLAGVDVGERGNADWPR